MNTSANFPDFMKTDNASNEITGFTVLKHSYGKYDPAPMYVVAAEMKEERGGVKFISDVVSFSDREEAKKMADKFNDILEFMMVMNRARRIMDDIEMGTKPQTKNGFYNDDYSNKKVKVAVGTRNSDFEVEGEDV